MTMLKRLLSQPWAQEAVAFLLLLYVELARRSIRWEVRGDEFVRQAWDEKLPLIGCVWHGRVLMTLQGCMMMLIEAVTIPPSHGYHAASGTCRDGVCTWFQRSCIV